MLKRTPLPLLSLLLLLLSSFVLILAAARSGTVTERDVESMRIISQPDNHATCSPHNPLPHTLTPTPTPSSTLSQEAKVALNCSLSLELNPPVFPAKKQIVSTAEALFHQNFTIAFLGDSTMYQQYERLCLMLGGRPVLKARNPSYMKAPGYCPLVMAGGKFNSTLRFFGIGKRFAWAALGPAYATLNRTLHLLGPTDAIVMNMGLHWAMSCSPKHRGANHEYVKDLLALEDVLDLMSTNSCRQHHTSVSLSYPLLVWRETLPQHFPTSNGLYPPVQRFHGDVEGLKRGKPLRCYELTPNKINGDGLREFNACNPTCLPATWQNDIANQVMASKCVDVLPVWEDLRCLHLHHANEDKWDCTHYNPHVVDLLNFKTLSLLTMLKKSKEGVGNT